MVVPQPIGFYYFIKMLVETIYIFFDYKLCHLNYLSSIILVQKGDY